MTDAEAKQRIAGTIEGLIEARKMDWPASLEAQYARSSALDVAALRHALQALDDRAALVNVPGWLSDRSLPLQEAIDAASRHMEGRP